MNIWKIGKKIRMCVSLVLEPFIEYWSSPMKRRSVRYARFHKHKAVKKQVILYEALGGQGQTDGVYALFQELTRNPEYRNLRHVWVLDDGRPVPDPTQAKQHTNTVFVSHKSKKYLKLLASAGVLISDTILPAYFVKKPEQVYIHIGQESAGKAGESDSFAEILSASDRARALLCADYVIAPPTAVTDFHRKVRHPDGVIQAPVRSGDGTKKKNILISRSAMLVNGISTALVNLLGQFDYEQYDVTVLVSSPETEGEKEQIKRLASNAGIRVVVRPDGMPVTLSESIKDGIFNQVHPKTFISRWSYSPALYQREFRRLFGDFRFDYIIDYDGYNIFYALLCLTQKDAKTYIWLHNDMLSEYKMRFRWLKLIFSVYERFDYIVSCSRQIMETNRKNFSTYLPEEKFRYAKNCVDFKRVMTGSRQGQVMYNGGYYYGLPDAENTNIHWLPLQPGEMKEWGEGETDIQTGGAKVDNGVTRFVNIGRLSVEKNQAALIRAFARLVEKNKQVMLYILGDGTEKENLAELISQLKLQENVFLTGNVSNPFGLLHQCHCFVLPSLHEGQPLVIFEARALHMPIIVSRFSSVGGSVIERGQYLIDMDEEAVYQGLEAYMAGDVPADYEFDAETYNREAYAEFEAAVLDAPSGADPDSLM